MEPEDRLNASGSSRGGIRRHLRRRGLSTTFIGELHDVARREQAPAGGPGRWKLAAVRKSAHLIGRQVEQPGSLRSLNLLHEHSVMAPRAARTGLLG